MPWATPTARHLPRRGAFARLALAAGLAAAVWLAACVEPSGNAADATPTASGPVVVTLGTPDEFALRLAPEVTSPADAVSFDITNEGELPHQVTLVRFDGDPATLPVANSRVNTDLVEVVATSAELAPGEAATLRAALDPGRYVVLCNITGHYAGGMFAPLLVE